MLDKTKKFLDTSLNTLKKIAFAFNIGSLSIYLLFLTYCIIKEQGNALSNILFLVAVIAYLSFYIVIHSKRGKDLKPMKKVGKRAYRWSKIIIRGLALVITFIGFRQSRSNPDIFNVIITVFMAIGWILTLVVEMIFAFILKRIKTLKSIAESGKERLSESLDKAKAAISKISSDSDENK